MVTWSGNMFVAPSCSSSHHGRRGAARPPEQRPAGNHGHQPARHARGGNTRNVWRLTTSSTGSCGYAQAGQHQRCCKTVTLTVWDRLFRLCPNLGQHPPFFSKMRTFFKNRPRWYHFYSNSAWYHRGRFLSCIFKKKFFFPVGILSQIGRCR